ncbi:Holliday junction resolvase MOC1, chloroplastic-like, partial [Cyclospora cayetanensis]|uniref:Holliday junction resolvase MOC1, chloroplastic-like n=1 Tax=Cyclospora cayetanensis TaxID=88456 RepID=A0A6P6S0T8_9EIME
AAPAGAAAAVAGVAAAADGAGVAAAANAAAAAQRPRITTGSGGETAKTGAAAATAVAATAVAATAAAAASSSLFPRRTEPATGGIAEAVTVGDDALEEEAETLAADPVAGAGEELLDLPCAAIGLTSRREEAEDARAAAPAAAAPPARGGGTATYFLLQYTLSASALGAVQLAVNARSIKRSWFRSNRSTIELGASPATVYTKQPPVIAVDGDARPFEAADVGALDNVSVAAPQLVKRHDQRRWGPWRRARMRMRQQPAGNTGYTSRCSP